MSAEIRRLVPRYAESSLVTEESFGLPSYGRVVWTLFPEDEAYLTPGRKSRPAIVLGVFGRRDAIRLMARLYGAGFMKRNEERLKRIESSYFMLVAKCTSQNSVDGRKRTEGEGRLQFSETKSWQAMGLDRPTMAEFRTLRVLPLSSPEFYADSDRPKIVGALHATDMKRSFAALRSVHPAVAREIQELTLTTTRFGERRTFLMNARLRLILGRGFDPLAVAEGEPWRVHAPPATKDANVR